MKIDEVNFQQVGNSASTELVGSCHDKKSEQVGNSASTQLVGFCYDKKSEQVTCSEQEQDAKHPSKIHDPSNTKSSTNNLRQCQTFVKNVSIDSWQCRMKIEVGNRASTQLVGSCHDEKSERAGCIASTQQDFTIQLIVGFRQYNQSSTRKSWQRQSFVDNVLINLWQSQMVNKNETSNLRQCQSFVNKLVVVSITNEYSKGVSSGSFHPFNVAPAFTAELIVALTSEQSNHELTELNGLVIHHEQIELIKGFVGHSELTKLTSLVHVGYIKLFKLSRLIVDSSSEGAQISKLIVDYILISSSEGARRAASKLIVDFVVHHELIELINGLVSHIELTELISHVIDGHMNYFQHGAASHFNDACIHRLIVVSVSEGARQVAPAQLADSFNSNLYRPGNIDSSQLIVYIISAKRASKLIVIYSKIPLRFNDKYGIFCEGEWEQQVGNISLAGYTSQISLVGHTGLVGLISFVNLGFFGVNGLIGINSLIGPIGLIG
jgi:hypothetical protein